MRYGHVDNTRSASAQGYQVVDEVKFLFGGSAKAQRKHPASDLVEEDEKIEDNTKSQGMTTCDQTSSEAFTSETGAGPSGTNSKSSGNSRGWKAIWSKEEIEELVTLRCQGLSHPVIANVNTPFFSVFGPSSLSVESDSLTYQTQDPKYLTGRDLKAIQQKFAKLVRVSPYKQRWDQYRVGKKRGKGSDGHQRNAEAGYEEDEVDEEG